MTRRKLRVAALAAVLIAGVSAPALATTLVQLSFEELVAESSVVVVGEAAASRVEQTESGLVTVTTFNVEESILGEAGVVEVSTPGGIYETNGILVQEAAAGTPVFLVGAEALLFLEGDATGPAQIVGFNQGAIGVFSTARGKSVRLPGADRAETIAEAGERIRNEKAAPKGGRGKTD